MDDDFNTAAALGHLYTLTRSLNALVDQKKKFPTFQIAEGTFARAREQFQMVESIFGLFRESPQAYFEKKKEKGIESAGMAPDEIEAADKSPGACEKIKRL